MTQSLLMEAPCGKAPLPLDTWLGKNTLPEGAAALPRFIFLVVGQHMSTWEPPASLLMVMMSVG